MTEPIGIYEYMKQLGLIMDQPPKMIQVQDLDGRVYEADASKVLDIAPSKLKAAMADPELRKLIVTRFPCSA